MSKSTYNVTSPYGFVVMVSDLLSVLGWYLVLKVFLRDINTFIGLQNWLLY